MRPILLLAIASLLPLAGCVGNAEGDDDRFAYMRKPLFATTFHLDPASNETQTQYFSVQDGSVINMRIYVWINATEGAATVNIINPSGNTIATFDETGQTSAHVRLGSWQVDVTPQEATDARVDVRVMRA